jgi:Uma2 family endonuclease
MLQLMLDPSDVAPEKLKSFTRKEYEKLVELGVFEDQRIELLRGMLVVMSPQGGPHATISSWFVSRLQIALGMDYDARGHCPYAATDDSEPEPDVSISRRTGLLTHPTHPLLLIEVAESSIRKDRRLKASIYAEAGAPEYWIVDISGEVLRVEVLTMPTPKGYRHSETLYDGDVLRPTTLPVEIAVADIPWTRS